MKPKGGKKADVISDPVLLEQYIALSDFQKCGKGQVNLVAGDVVEVIEKSDNGRLYIVICKDPMVLLLHTEMQL